MQHRACHLRAVSLRDFATFIGELTVIRGWMKFPRNNNHHRTSGAGVLSI